MSSGIEPALPPGAAGAGFGRAAARWFDRLLFALAVVAAAIVALVALAIGFEVVMRYFLNRPTRWVIEFSEYALVYIAFLGGAWVLREDSHVSVELLVDALPREARRWLRVVTSLLGAAICATIAWVSTSYTYELYESGEVLFRSLQTPKWAILAIIPAGMVLLAIQFLRRAFTAPAPGPGGGY